MVPWAHESMPAKPAYDPFSRLCRAHWCAKHRLIDPIVRGSDAVLCEITCITCFLYARACYPPILARVNHFQCITPYEYRQISGSDASHSGQRR